jgi:hypothetical protein
LSCIVTLPTHQRKGYGQFLIEISMFVASHPLGYLLSQKEKKMGSPEKPLSELGRLSYRSFWKRTVMKYLKGNKGGKLQIAEISRVTNMTLQDVVHTLLSLGFLIRNHHHYSLKVNYTLIDDYLSKYQAKGYPTAKAELLQWTPFLLRALGGVPDEEDNRDTRESSVVNEQTPALNDEGQKGQNLEK